MLDVLFTWLINFNQFCVHLFKLFYLYNSILINLFDRFFCKPTSPPDPSGLQGVSQSGGLKMEQNVH